MPSPPAVPLLPAARHCPSMINHAMTSEPPATRMPPLHRAATAGRVSEVAMLLDRGAHIEARDPDMRTPLHAAASAGREDVVALLLDRGANKEATDVTKQTPL